jgi:hypothetical protein
MEKKVLNISNAINIDLPKLNKPDSFYSNPKEYWNLYNKGESLYKNI